MLEFIGLAYVVKFSIGVVFLLWVVGDTMRNTKWFTTAALKHLLSRR